VFSFNVRFFRIFFFSRAFWRGGGTIFVRKFQLFLAQFWPFVSFFFFASDAAPHKQEQGFLRDSFNKAICLGRGGPLVGWPQGEFLGRRPGAVGLWNPSRKNFPFRPRDCESFRRRRGDVFLLHHGVIPVLRNSACIEMGFPRCVPAIAGCRLKAVFFSFECSVNGAFSSLFCFFLFLSSLNTTRNDGGGRRLNSEKQRVLGSSAMGPAAGMAWRISFGAIGAAFSRFFFFFSAFSRFFVF